jgi:hypothetical protein
MTLVPLGVQVLQFEERCSLQIESFVLNYDENTSASAGSVSVNENTIANGSVSVAGKRSILVNLQC